MLRRALALTAVAAVALAGAATSLLASGTAAPARSTTTTLTSTVALSSTTSTAMLSTTAPATTTSPSAATTTVGAATTTVAATPPPALTTSTAPSTVVLSGHGWGHGVGMGQWGAYGYALHGWTYAQILAHYYTGTTLGTAPGATVRVLLGDGKKRVTLASASRWQLVDGAGRTVALPAGTLVLTPALTVNGQQLASPLLVKPGPAPLQVGTTPYRGRLRVILVGKTLQVVNVVGIEQYLQGVVPSESPSTWPAQALDAQAVAARSYALAQLTTVVTASNFDLYADTRSQVYGGLAAESAAGNQAVHATLHQVVLYHGQIATTYFSASTGGRTVSAAEAFGKAIPYLVSVPDPYDSYSPYHSWGPLLYDARAVAKAVGLAGQSLVDLQATPGPSGRVATVTAIGSGSQVALTGDALRADLGLRSSWFSVGWLALDPPTAPVAFGGTVTLSGVARGVGSVTLEARPAGGDWQTLASVVPDGSGAFTTTVTPQVTTQYRLTAGTLHAGLVRAAVVPVVQATLGTGAVAGTVQPALAGSAVQLQLRDGVGWTTVATATTDTAGSFTMPAPLSPGSYRVRIAPGRGLSPGFSPALDVP
ncbi:MAG TPA: SpoIID/LytB domain-containing protein [Gaiellaceae bacterium]|nr:SpoIID/LytB domain-containing protein [Gaiellaceae bacterium]